MSKGVSVLVVLVKSDGGAGYEDGETSGPRIRATGSLSLSTPPPALSDNYKSGKELHLELSNTSYFLISSEAVEGAALNPT